MKEYDRKSANLEKRAECREAQMVSLHRLGERFLQDKGTLEARLEKIRSLALPDEQKVQLLSEVEGLLQQLQQQYDRDVAAMQEKLMQETEEDQAETEERARELEDLAANLQEAKMDAARVDLQSVTEMAERERADLLARNSETVQRMQKMQADARLQRESIHQRPKW